MKKHHHNSANNILDVLSVDEWHQIFTFVPVNRGILDLMTCCSFMYQIIDQDDSFWFQLLQIYYPHSIVDRELVQQQQNQPFETTWKKEFKKYHLLLEWDSEERNPYIELSDHNRTLYNPTQYYFLPIRMKYPIMKSEEYMLCIEIQNSNESKVYGSSIGIVTHPLLYEHLGNGFKNPVFKSLTVRDDTDRTTYSASQKHVSTSALYLGHYYVPLSVSYAATGRPDPNVPARYHNCGFFDNGYLVFSNGSYGHEGSWEKNDVIKMHVSLTYNGGGFVQYFVNEKPIGKPFYDIYKPTNNNNGGVDEYEVYAAMTVGREWKLQTRAKYIPLVPPVVNQVPSIPPPRGSHPQPQG